MPSSAAQPHDHPVGQPLISHEDSKWWKYCCTSLLEKAENKNSEEVLPTFREEFALLSFPMERRGEDEQFRDRLKERKQGIAQTMLQC